MNNKNKTKFEQQLDSIIGATNDVNDELENIEDEKTQLPDVVEYDQVPTVITQTDEINQDKLDDYNKARSTLHGLVDRGVVALEGSLIIARESEHPRAYEVSSTLIKTIADISKDLLKLQDDLTPKQNIKIGKQINQQNNFTAGSNNEETNPKDLMSELDDLEDLGDDGE